MRSADFIGKTGLEDLKLRFRQEYVSEITLMDKSIKTILYALHTILAYWLRTSLAFIDWYLTASTILLLKLF